MHFPYQPAVSTAGFFAGMTGGGEYDPNPCQSVKSVVKIRPTNALPVSAGGFNRWLLRGNDGRG